MIYVDPYRDELRSDLNGELLSRQVLFVNAAVIIIFIVHVNIWWGYSLVPRPFEGSLERPGNEASGAITTLV